MKTKFRHSKTILTFMLCLLLMCSPLFGCASNNNENKDSEGNIITDETKILDINTWNAGFGTEWLNALANAFKTKNPGVAVNVRAKADQGDFYNTITTGKTANDTDLYFTYGPKYLQYVTGQYANNKMLEPLDDVLAFKVEGETKTIGEKIGAERLSALTANVGGEDVTYALNYGNASGYGIVYNAEKFEEYGLSVPRTSNELRNLAYTIVETTPYDGKTPGAGGTALTPFIHHPGYWQSVALNWWAQYADRDEFDSFWSFEGVDLDNITTQRNVIYTDSISVALEALYSIISPEGFTYAESNTMEFNIKQARFLKQDVALMYPCGSWLETEMAKAEDFDVDTVMNRFASMKVPVISKLSEKLSEGNRTESKLIELIDYVDGVTQTAPSWATPEDIELVDFARNVSPSAIAANTVCIPSYSPAKDLAKKFLEFVYSDEGMLIYTEAQKAVFGGADFDDAAKLEEIDTSEWTTYSKSCYENSINTKILPINVNSPLRYRTTLTEWFTTTPEAMFTNPSAASRGDVSDFLDYEWNELMRNWNVIYESSGLKS